MVQGSLLLSMTYLMTAFLLFACLLILFYERYMEYFETTTKDEYSKVTAATIISC